MVDTAIDAVHVWTVATQIRSLDGSTAFAYASIIEAERLVISRKTAAANSFLSYPRGILWLFFILIDQDNTLSTANLNILSP